MRKLATIRRIDDINPIEGADKIVRVTVGGWDVVAQIGLYNIGDLVVYFEIDSWIPTELAPFLSKGKEPREFEGVRGERLRTIRLRGQLSQGLLLPLNDIKQYFIDADIVYNIDENIDVTELLNIKKWERPMSAQLSGMAKGNFPTIIPKTDQERVQNLKQEIAEAADCGQEFEVTEKLEGSSMTAFLINGEFGVCSRNLDLKETADNSFWVTARADDIEAKMRAEVGTLYGNKIELSDFAIQGELVGPGIQDNIYNLSKHKFYVFDVYDIKAGKYLIPYDRFKLIEKMGLLHVPVISSYYQVSANIEDIIAYADGESLLAKTKREGIVLKSIDGKFNFKAISNSYLLSEK